MGHTNSTPNLHLPQFIGSDKPTWLSDVNGAMLAIDTAYGTIEAEASSAATAAAGAVTVAGAAQTAADSAATAAATAGTNASQALSTANNAAYTANQADGKAGSALELAEGKVIAEVTADGVKTHSQLLDELVLALTDTPSPRSILQVSVEYFQLSASSDGVYIYGNARDWSGPEMRVRGATLKTAGGSTLVIANITSGVSVTDQSSSVPSQGGVYRIYK